jgi:iron-sulfur cluster assembly protein
MIGEGSEFFCQSLHLNLQTFRAMISVAESAKTRIERIREDQNMSEEHFLRVSVVSGGCSGLSYKIEFDDQPKPDDQIFEDKGIKIVTDLRSFLYLCNSTLEFSGGLNGQGFYFHNPNASRTCSCGESFAV